MHYAIYATSLESYISSAGKHHVEASTLPAPSDILGKDAVYTITPNGTITAQENNRRPVIPRPNNWPHWCVYIAWTLCVLAILASGFFAILYSFEWGRDKANRWLSNMMLSFWQSVLIVQPIKVSLVIGKYVKYNLIL